MDLPLERIRSDSEYVIYCKSEGLISGHATAPDALKSFAAYLRNKIRDKGESGWTEPVIYKREIDGWILF